jgi:hypothetical protein
MAEIDTSGGFNLNGMLNNLIGAYSSVSMARAKVDAIKYQGAIDNQNATLNSPQGTKYANNTATAASLNRANSISNAGTMVIPPALIYGGLALGVGFLLLKALK